MCLCKLSGLVGQGQGQRLEGTCVGDGEVEDTESRPVGESSAAECLEEVHISARGLCARSGRPNELSPVW